MYPACGWLLKRPGKTWRYRFYSCIAFLAVVAAGQVWYGFHDTQENYFQVLQIPRVAAPQAVKKAYRTLSRTEHPDKGGSAEKFQRIGEAYEVLAMPQRREVYDRFGAEGLHHFDKAGKDHVQDSVIGIAMYHVVWAALVYVITAGQERRRGRGWALAGLALNLGLEVGLKFGDFDFGWAEWLLFPRWTRADQVSMLHLVYPSVMNACVVLSSVTYYDLETENYKLLRNLFEMNKQMLIGLRTIHNEVAALPKGKAGAAATKAAAAAVAQGEAQFANLPRNLIRGGAHGGAQQAAVQDPNKSRIPSWVWMLGMYFLFNYVLK